MSARAAPFTGGCLTVLPVRPYGAVPEVDAFNAAVVSHQHPDHDTAEWPPKQGFPA